MRRETFVCGKVGLVALLTTGLVACSDSKPPETTQDKDMSSSPTADMGALSKESDE